MQALPDQRTRGGALQLIRIFLKLEFEAFRITLQKSENSKDCLNDSLGQALFLEQLSIQIKHYFDPLALMSTAERFEKSPESALNTKDSLHVWDISDIADGEIS